ncbi:MAG: hypothetical protein JXR78_16690 [Victivallales bacterium]|nr:hypothetical protein [Victivallales bacterium]
MISYPNGYIMETENSDNAFLVYGELNHNGHVSKGYRLHVPNISNSGWAQKNELCQHLQAYLSRFDSGKRLQFRYRKDSNYRKILEKYESDTELFTDVPFVRKYRDQVAAEFRREMESHELRREYLTVYVSRPAKQFIAGALDVNSEKVMLAFKEKVGNYFESEYLLLKSAFTFHVEKLNAVQLFAEFFSAVNKSLSAENIDYSKIFSPNLYDLYLNEFSSQDHSPEPRHAESAVSRGYGMYGDGMYHNILVMRQMPTFELNPFYGNILLESNVGNFSVTVNLKPLSKVGTIEKLEARQAAAQRDLEADPSAIAYRSEVDAFGRMIYRMGAGEDCPFEAEYLIHIWNGDLEMLQQDTNQLRLVATNLQCQLMMHDLTVQSEAQFLKTLPGNLYYKKWDALFTLHRSFAAMIPFNSTFVGCEDDFQAIFHGDHHNIVCVNGFSGGTPQHAASFGQSGSGKSVNTLGELLQSYGYYSKVVIIEEGASYLMATRIFGGQFVEIDLNNNLTLNYFDTCGSPLNAGQMDFVSNFLTSMCGQSKDDEIVQDRMAIISHYVTKIYDVSWQEWWKRNTHLRTEIARKSMTLEWMLPRQPAGRNTLLDCFADLEEILAKERGKLSAVEKQSHDYWSRISVEKITEYIVMNPPLLRDVSYAHMKAADMPYHSQIVEMIRSTPDPVHRREDTNRIATRLAQYMAESGRGGLFDGVTNVDLSARWIHFELGKMASASVNFKSMIGLVIGNMVRNQIVNMPRSAWKLYIFEEAPRFLQIPGAAEIMKQSYAQFRKFNCRAWTITQEAGQLLENGADVGTIIMSQSKQYYFLKNKDQGNMRFFRRFVNLSDDTVNSIMSFPSPEHIPGRKYSSFVYCVDGGEYPQTGVIRHYANELTIAVASSSGKAFSEREQELRKLRIMYPDFAEGELLIEHLNRQKINNPALCLFQKMLHTHDFSEADELKEEIIRLSLQVSKLKRGAL